ncbi:MAG: hypothetical protein GY903_28590 [Fuerstiella sp.]|nr:hypothetical protein [Fuerstiella sp.]MCP4787298.1 hypothetical protein [Fuerstiella sp.]MCP4858453.1 hypothetical protein [Fuerstiella sp.]
MRTLPITGGLAPYRSQEPTCSDGLLTEHDYPDAAHIHLIPDNDSIHNSKLTRLALDTLNDRITLHLLPPYCPRHNRIERVWKHMHANVTRNHTCTSIEELIGKVEVCIRFLSRNLETIPI